MMDNQMKVRKKVSARELLPILTIWAVMLAAGIFYNYYGIVNYLSTGVGRHILWIGGGAIICAVVYVYDLIMDGASFAKGWGLGKFLIAFFALGMLFGIAEYIDLDYFLITAVAVTVLFPTTFAGIKQMMLCSKSPFDTAVVMIAGGIVAYIVWNLKMAFVAGAVFILAEIVALAVFKPKDRELWIFQLVVSAVIGIVIAVVIIGDDLSLSRRATAIFNTDMYEEFDIINLYLSNARLIEFRPAVYFTYDINSRYACTYLHFLLSFGIIPAVLMLGAQIFALVLMWRNTSRFTKLRRRYLGFTMCGILSGYILISIISSAVRLPWVEFGAPFLTTFGITVSMLTVAVYAYLHSQETKKWRRVRNKHRDWVQNVFGVSEFEDVDV